MGWEAAAAGRETRFLDTKFRDVSLPARSSYRLCLLCSRLVEFTYPRASASFWGALPQADLSFVDNIPNLKKRSDTPQAPCTQRMLF
jgi:hypothetical protein